MHQAVNDFQLSMRTTFLIHLIELGNTVYVACASMSDAMT